MFTAPDRFWVRMVARVRPGTSRAAIEQSIGTVFRDAIVEAGLLSRDSSESASVRLLPGHRGIDTLRGNTERPLYLLTGVVVLVLVIACVNLASLMLARGVSRQREIAVRQALGGSRLRLIRQFLVESLILAIAGGALGLLLALWTGPVITEMLTAGFGPVAVEFLLDWKMLATTAVVACSAAVLFGLLPALRLTSLKNPSSYLGHRTAGGPAPRLTIGRALIAIQVAISIPLVVGAGLFLQTIRNLDSVDLGFNPAGLVLFRLDPTLNDNDSEKHARIYQEVLTRMEAIPGVQSATLVENALVSGITSNTNVTAGEQQGGMYKNAVGPRFFETMGMPIIAGRGLGLQDHAGAQRVVVINEAAARKYFRGSPLGQRIKYGSRDDEVVGVVRDSKYYSLRQTSAEPTMYDAFLQRSGGPGALHVIVRTTVVEASLERSIRQAVSEVDRNLPVSNFRTQFDQIDATLGRERALANVLVVFAGFALLLACIGLHGVTSYAVARRTSEIGIRLAVGAQRGQVVWLVLRQVIVLAVAGVSIGTPVAIGVAPAVRSFLYGITPRDPLIIIAAASVMFTVAIVAGFLPARRASRIEVLAALRHG